jgi:cell pole-organizing protein PopZ
MPMCLDRTLMRMGQSKPAEPPVPASGEVPKGTLGTNYLVGEGSRPEPESEEAADLPADLLRKPPVKEEGASWQLEHSANLLRPMLRVWLDDNIKRVFAQALAGAVQAGSQR